MISYTLKNYDKLFGALAEHLELVGITPVSYTHLDVYKRQTLQAPADFEAFIGNAGEPVFWHFLFMMMTALICFFGVRGIEKASKFMMPALFVILLVIVVRSVTLPGASKGLAFIFSIKDSKFSIGSINAALGQVFYSLSLCMGITITYGSYLNKKESIPKSCISVALLDTCMAVLAGVAILSLIHI